MSEDMTTRERLVGPARLTALVVIAVLVIGLGYLAFAPEDSVEVPGGARAGDLSLEPCEYETEAGGFVADCGTLVVPENRADPGSRLIALPVSRILATSEHPGEPIFRLQGGPGQSNMDFPEASRYAENHDVVLVGYRGIDGSVRLDCPEVESAIAHSTDFLGERLFEAYEEAFRSCADRLTGQGIDLASYGLVQQVDDLEVARVALGYDRVNLLSESAGTRTAMIYGWRYPESIHRSVMFGVNPPGNFLWDPTLTDEQLGRYADLCSQDETCRARTEDLATSIEGISADMPERWLFLPIKQGNVATMSFTMMIQSTSEAGLASAPVMFDAWLSAAEGDPSGLWFTSVMADVLYPRLFTWGQFAAGARVDARAARDYFSSGGEENGVNLGRAATEFVWAGGRLIDSWPAAREESEYSRVRQTEVETLLIGGELDTATPPQLATTQLLPYLANGHEVVLTGFMHSPSFWNDQPEAGTRLITTFFDSGQVDDSLYRAQSVPVTPTTKGTTLAKRMLATIIGFAVLMVVSLIWMARQVHRRGHFSQTAGAALRSLYPIVLGLGGWSLGVLVVLTAMPGVPLDDGLLSVVSVSTPIGLGIYWAWVHREWSPTTKTRGLLTAMGGALLGGWLGYNATEGPVTLITTLVGAVVGANLLLILGDIYEDRAAAMSQAQRHPPLQAHSPSHETQVVRFTD
jgi:pimeloyl-ACP methyl ester carboxylesterase/uncharacterized membrane protein YeaQ/YmgE (transglycosylase-associated protein family)